MKTIYVLLLICIVTSFRTYSQESKLLSKTEDLGFCIDSTELKIGAIYPPMPKSDVLEIIGQADSIRIDHGLIDFSATHFYDGLIIYYWDDQVVGMIASSDKYITPSGIHTGLSGDKVFEILGVEQNESLLQKHKIEFTACNNYDFKILLIFDNTLILREIHIGFDLF